MWDKIYFEEFIELQRGFDLPERSREAGEYPVVASTSVVGYHNSFKVEPPCVVTGRSGSLGIVQLIKRPCYPLNTTLFVRDFKGNDPRFVYYFLPTLRLENYDSGAGVPTLNRNDLDKLKISIPPVPIQVRVADILANYDDLIENYHQQIQILESTAQNIYREWFVRGRCPYAAYTKGSTDPIGWDTVKLGSVMELKYGKSLIEDDREVGEFPVVGSSGIVDFHCSFLVDGPGIVVGRKGNVGSVYWMSGPFYPIDTVFYVETSLSLYYLFFNLQSQNFLSGDAAVPGLNKEQALSNLILLPGRPVLERFDQLVKPLFEKASNLRLQVSRLRHMRERLVPRLLSGKLQVIG